ncbi:MAG: hypothetical protein QOC74_3500 [Pseudonocardiales bacterium]|nr:hypothetical protein [Pseudonocardiales bacterium]
MNSIAARSGTPRSRSTVAAVCRASCRRADRTPASSRRVSQSRRSCSGRMGRPLGWAKIQPPSSHAVPACSRSSLWATSCFSSRAYSSSGSEISRRPALDLTSASTRPPLWRLGHQRAWLVQSDGHGGGQGGRERAGWDPTEPTDPNTGHLAGLDQGEHPRPTDAEHLGGGLHAEHQAGLRLGCVVVHAARPIRRTPSCSCSNLRRSFGVIPPSTPCATSRRFRASARLSRLTRGHKRPR